jgi:transcriptional regulator with XRE-family HTH domain
MSVAEEQGKALEREIAQRIRDKRLSLGWSLDKLAQVTGLSKSYLSQIENCEKNPPISTLTKIAFGLGENVVTLISGEPPPAETNKFTVVRASERRPITHLGAAPGSMYEAVAYKRPDRLMDSYIVTVSHDLPEKQLMHQGQEIAFALEGRHQFYYDGQTYEIEPGDCTYFDSDRPHMARSLGEKPAKVLVVWCNPLRAK